MSSLIGYISFSVVAARISVIDIKTHFIRNSDLLILLLIVIGFFENNLNFGVLNLSIYFAIYYLSRKQLGFGDVKLAFILGLGINSIFTLICALNIAWVSGGFWAFISKQKRIAFAPWMLVGACLAKIMVI